jgi:hypothetical protein
MLTSFSTMVGGGVCGKAAGIAHGTMIQIGFTIKASHPFMCGYRRVGGMITEIIVGEDSNGTTSEYLSNNFSGTGATGKKTGIGRSSKHGVSKV